VSPNAAPHVEQPIRAAEVVGALSLATDLGTGQPLEHALRTAVLAVRLGELAGASTKKLADTNYASLLHASGCTSNGHEATQLSARTSSTEPRSSWSTRRIENRSADSRSAPTRGAALAKSIEAPAEALDEEDLAQVTASGPQRSVLVAALEVLRDLWLAARHTMTSALVTRI